MDKEIKKELSKIAKEILESVDSSDYQKIYDQTLFLFEKLILIKGSNKIKKWFKKDLNLDFNQADGNSKLKSQIFSDKIKGNKNLNINQSKKKNIFINQNNFKVEKKNKTYLKKITPKQRLNEKFSNNLRIDLNDKTSFIKHLFDNSPNEYQRIISQISTFEDWIKAEKFILEIVKPDYKNWEGKEFFERKFIKTVKNFFH